MERIPKGKKFQFKALLDDKQWVSKDNVFGVGREEVETSVHF